MKIIAKIILTIIFIPVFFLFLFAVNVRFQLLASSFWEKTMNSGNVYSKLSASINKNLETKTIAEGGRASDVEVLTSLITPENLKETINKNINNILQFVNGKSPELFLYIPVDKIPKAFLSKNLSGITEQMKLTDLVQEFNIENVSSAQIQMISEIGITSWIFFGVTSFLLILIIFFLYLLVDRGKRLGAIGLALVLAGGIVFVISFLGRISLTNFAKDEGWSTNLANSLVGAVTPPLFQEILRTWSLFATIAIFVGFVLFFIKKNER